MMKKGPIREESCNFCRRTKRDVQLLIAGMEGFICDSCATEAYNVVRNELPDDHQQEAGASKKKGKKKEYNLQIAPPQQIKLFLDKYIIGQDSAKKYLSVAVYNHYKRLRNKNLSDVEFEKSNVLFVGPTGTGKTLMARTIARLLNVPFAIVDATVFTESGYVGEDIESILSRLLAETDFDVEAAEMGIVYIDEIDKIARKGDNPSITRDVSGEGVQQGLLKMLEGAEVLVPPHGGRKHPEQKLIKVDTRNILFICGGAFDGIDKVIARRVNTSVIGFRGADAEKIDRENLIQYVTPYDIKSFGLIPELVGRLPVLAYLETLDQDALRKILTEPRNALIKQYVKLFELENVELIVTDDGLDYIAATALEYKLGARGLRSLCEAIFTDAMFEMPGSEHAEKLVIDTAYCRLKVERTEVAGRLKAA